MTTQKSKLRDYPYVDVPWHYDVADLLDTQLVSDTYLPRTSGEAKVRLEVVEHMHRKWVEPMIDLSGFEYCYVTNGTTDAIHHWVMTEDRGWQYMEGEYEYPGMCGLPGVSICDVPGQYMDPETHRAALSNQPHPDIPLFISIPSAADGNIFDLKFESWKVKPPVILDCTYIGATEAKKIPVPSTTEQIFFSFSKGFGAIGQRLGLVYTKQPHPSLHRLKRYQNWNYNSVETMRLLMRDFRVDEMWTKYRKRQLSICEQYGFTPSSVYYLATTKDPYYKKRRRMRWNDDARICLSSIFPEQL